MVMVIMVQLEEDQRRVVEETSMCIYAISHLYEYIFWNIFVCLRL